MRQVWRRLNTCVGGGLRSLETSSKESRPGHRRADAYQRYDLRALPALSNLPLRNCLSGRLRLLTVRASEIAFPGANVERPRSLELHLDIVPARPRHVPGGVLHDVVRAHRVDRGLQPATLACFAEHRQQPAPRRVGRLPDPPFRVVPGLAPERPPWPGSGTVIPERGPRSKSRGSDAFDQPKA